MSTEYYMISLVCNMFFEVEKFLVDRLLKCHVDIENLAHLEETV